MAEWNDWSFCLTPISKFYDDACPGMEISCPNLLSRVGYLLAKDYIPYYIGIGFRRWFLSLPPTENDVGEECRVRNPA